MHSFNANPESETILKHFAQENRHLLFYMFIIRFSLSSDDHFVINLYSEKGGKLRSFDSYHGEIDNFYFQFHQGKQDIVLNQFFFFVMGVQHKALVVMTNCYYFFLWKLLELNAFVFGHTMNIRTSWKFA